MAEPQWTVNGRSIPAGNPLASETAMVANDAAKVPVACADPTSSPIDALLSDRTQFTAEEDAEIQRSMARHHVDREHPVIQVLVDSILHSRQQEQREHERQRQYREQLLGDLQQYREQSLADLKAVAIDVKTAEKKGVSLVVQPTTSAAVYVGLTAVIAAVAWLAGQAVGVMQNAAQLRAAAPQVATLLTTSPGQAALRLVRDNGDALPKILSQCHQFVDQGRDAMTCTLWARGTGVPLTTPSALDSILATVLAIPAWPVVLVILIAAGVALVWRSGRNVAAKASSAW